VVTITITNSGVSPSSVQVRVGGRVRFVNQSNAPHDVASDPHPIHTDCPQINLVGLLNPGQSRETGTFPQPRGCGFHDHNDPNNPLWWGGITVGP
jgi:plastocyanin